MKGQDVVSHVISPATVGYLGEEARVDLTSALEL